MATAIKNFTTETFVPAIKTTGENIQKGIAKIYGISTTVENFIHSKLPSPVATITCVFLRTLPFLIMFATCPPLISVAVTAPFCAIKVIATKDLENFKIQGALVAIALSALYVGIRLVPWSAPLAIGLALMVSGAIGLAESGVLCEILRSCPKPKEDSSDQEEIEMKTMPASDGAAQPASDSQAAPSEATQTASDNQAPPPENSVAKET